MIPWALIVLLAAHQPTGRHVAVVQADSAGVVQRHAPYKLFDECRCCGWVEADSIKAICRKRLRGACK